MESKTKKTLKYNESDKKFHLRIEEESEVILGKEVLGISKSLIEQEFTKEGMEKIRDNLIVQRNNTSIALEITEKQIKDIGKLTDRETQKLEIFKKQMEQVQKVQQLEQFNNNLVTQRDMLKKLVKDLKEVEDGLSQVKTD